VLEAMLPFLREQWGNPSSLYGPGRQARQALDGARRAFGEILGCTPNELIFTGSGSEGANLAIKGLADAAPAHRRQIITTRVEHHAVLEVCAELAQLRGFEVTYLDVDEHGLVSLDHLERVISERTALVSVMYANNEVGTIQPIRDVARIAHAHGVPVHTDAVQAAGALPLDVEALGVDLLSIAGHKFYAPKGVGLLYARHGTRLLPQIRGGGQERGRRSGTENVASIVGMATALSLAQSSRESVNQRLWQITSRLLRELPARVPDCRITGHPRQRLPNHASFAFGGVEIAPVLIGLDRQEIWASSGSACTSASSEPSHVLVAMGVPRSHLFGALRLTLGLDNNPAAADTLLEAIPPLVAGARRAVA
jgi:cysteine desulfurase